MMTLEHVMDSAKLEGTAGDLAIPKSAFLAITGAALASVPGSFGIMPKEEFELVIGALRVRSGFPDAEVAPNLVQRAVLLTVGYVCRLRTGFWIR